MPSYLATVSIALVVCVFLHLAAILLAGFASGVELRQFSFGIGPRLWKLRRFELKLFPFAGNVEFRNLRSEEVDTTDIDVLNSDTETFRYLDLQPRYRQVLISLSGCAALLVLAYAVLGSRARIELVQGFGQIIGGALSPLDGAQDLLETAQRQLFQLSPVHILALVAVKLAALNLLPLAPFNGASAINVALSVNAVSSYWWDQWTRMTIWISIAMSLSWLVALMVYLGA
ncbi:MAG: hypothetical protein EOP20_02330 [Hyphomicrobiales bacterium]|nr:MAG: hypothetical protein EOP20_02330 [Hyphomicrobiales bacterium]